MALAPMLPEAANLWNFLLHVVKSNCLVVLTTRVFIHDSNPRPVSCKSDVIPIVPLLEYDCQNKTNTAAVLPDRWPHPSTWKQESQRLECFLLS